MRAISNISALAITLLFLCACANTGVGTVKALDTAQANGSPFTQRLTTEYRDMVHRLQGSGSRHYTSSNALRFSRKGLAAAQGTVVLPEALPDWDLSEKNLSEMAPARADLLEVLDRGARESFADTAAVAQAGFDCWVMEQESDRASRKDKMGTADACKNKFATALAEIKAKMPARVVAETPAPAVVIPVAAPAVEVQKPDYIINFAWNKTAISPAAKKDLDAAVAEINSRSDLRQVAVIGYADTSGGGQYNDKLSLKRTFAVRDYLVAHGVKPGLIRIGARGETDLHVPTPDDVKELGNRCVQITLERAP